MPWGLSHNSAICGSTGIIDTGMCVPDGKDINGKYLYKRVPDSYMCVPDGKDINGKTKYDWVPDDYKCVPDGKDRDGKDKWIWVPDYYEWYPETKTNPHYKISNSSQDQFKDGMGEMWRDVDETIRKLRELRTIREQKQTRNYEQKPAPKQVHKAYVPQPNRFKSNDEPEQHERRSLLSLRDNEQSSEEKAELPFRRIMEHLKPVEEPKNNPNSHLYKTKYRNNVQQEEQTKKPSFKMVIPSEEITISSLEYKLLTKDRGFIQGVELIEEGFTYVTLNCYKHKTDELKKELVKIRTQNKQTKRMLLDDVLNLLVGKLELRTEKEETHGLKLPTNLIELSECLESSECMSKREFYAQYFRSNFEKRCTKAGIYCGFELEDVLDYTTHEMVYQKRKPDFTIDEISKCLKERRAWRKKEEFVRPRLKILEDIDSGKITKEEGFRRLKTVSQFPQKEKPNIALRKELKEKHEKGEKLRMGAFGDMCDHADKFDKPIDDVLESCKNLGIHVYLEA